MKPFRPCNGTEGDMFMERVCSGCAKNPNSTGEWCEIMGGSWMYEIDNPQYPKEMQCEDPLDPRTWACTGKIEGVNE